MKATKKKSKPKDSAYHHGDLKKTLIQCAVRMLEKVHPEDLSLRELARLAGVSQAAPYRHFKNKEELVAAISQQGFELKFGYLLDAIRKYRSDPKEMYFQCALAYFRMGREHPQHFRLMISSSVKPCPDYPDLLAAASATFVVVRDMVEICQSAGVLGEGDPYQRAMNCWAVVNGFTALYADDRLSWLGIDDANAEHFLRGLMTQYLMGASQDLAKSPRKSALFTGELPSLYLSMMNQQKYES